MTYFLSDAHLGSRAIDNPETHQQTVISMLNHMEKDATAIYLLGDIFDFWCEYFWRDRSKEQYRPILNKLKSLTDKGIQIHFFIGNHDIWTFGWLAQQTGVQVHRKPATITLNGKRIFIAHGDGLVPSNYLQQLPKTIQRTIRNFIFLRKVFHNLTMRRHNCSKAYALLRPRRVSVKQYVVVLAARLSHLVPNGFRG